MTHEAFWKIMRIIGVPFVIIFAVGYAFILFYVIISFIQIEFPGWISGEKANPNYVRNSLELIYFASNSVVAVIAVMAIWFARKQAREAEHARREAEKARLVDIYTTIEARWASPDIKSSRRYFRDLITEFLRKHGSVDTKNLPIFVNDKLHALSLLNPYQYMEAMSAIDFFEYLAMMESKQYLRIEDLEPFIGQAVIEFDDLVAHHIAEIRRAYQRHAANRGLSRSADTYVLFTDLADKFRQRFL